MRNNNINSSDNKNNKNTNLFYCNQMHHNLYVGHTTSILSCRLTCCLSSQHVIHAHIDKHRLLDTGASPTSIRQVLVDNTHILYHINCRKRFQILEALIKIKNPKLNKIFFNQGIGILNVFNIQYILLKEFLCVE